MAHLGLMKHCRPRPSFAQPLLLSAKTLHDTDHRAANIATLCIIFFLLKTSDLISI
jgi:hypothetical protein